MQQTIFQIRNLSVRIRDKTLLEIDRLEIPAGMTVVIGPNGAGKSTLLRALIGQIGQGEITLFGEAVAPQIRAGRVAWVGQLSGGEQQRANIIRALLQNAPVLLLDEPCNHLDIRHQHRLMQYLVGYSNRASSMMVLHDLNLAARYAEHIILMNRGKVVASGKVGEVMHPDLLESVYGWQIRRCEDEAGFYFRS